MRHAFTRLFLFLLFAAALTGPATVRGRAATSFTLDHGLAAYQVLQRSEQGQAAAALSGTAGAAGAIEARVLKGNDAAQAWRKIAEVRDGKWEGRLEGIPTGGPYRVELRLVDGQGKEQASTAVDQVLVGDLWVLAGQSNMQGVGDLVDVEPSTPLVHAFDMADHWQIASEPLHWLLEAVDPVHWRGLTDPAERKGRAEAERKQRTKGTGLGLPFAAEMVRRTGVPVGLVPCAHGGTSMDQWSPAKKDEGGNSLYGAMIRRIGVVGGRVKGVLWYQGESDAQPSAFPEFAGKFENLIASIRRDVNQPNLPFYYVQLGRFVAEAEPKGWNTVQEVQRQTALKVPYTAAVPAIDLELDDLIHVGTDGLKRLGRRLAKIACRELFGQQQILPGPHFREVRSENSGRTLRVAYSDVNGRLSPARQIGGFSIHNAEGKKLPLIFEAKVDSQRPDTVLLMLNAPAPADASLAYGQGLDPYCNLRDSEDMAAPVMGPIPLANLVSGPYLAPGESPGAK